VPLLWNIYGVSTVNWAGAVTWIMPAHMHISLQVLSTAGGPPSNTVVTPGTQGMVVAGTQGIGVRTPSAAAVAAATVGLAGLEHIPNEGTLAKGMLSMMFAAGMPPAITQFTGRTCSAPGAAPKLHESIVPLVTCRDICFPDGSATSYQQATSLTPGTADFFIRDRAKKHNGVRRNSCACTYLVVCLDVSGGAWS
jgi:hypothetical protein